MRETIMTLRPTSQITARIRNVPQCGGIAWDPDRVEPDQASRPSRTRPARPMPDPCAHHTAGRLSPSSESDSAGHWSPTRNHKPARPGATRRPTETEPHPGSMCCTMQASRIVAASHRTRWWRDSHKSLRRCASRLESWVLGSHTPGPAWVDPVDPRVR